jgi:uncharacterized damage-inducible protein DinB
MDIRLASLASILRLNTQLVLNCFDGVSEHQAAARPVAGCNSMSFLLAHLIDARHMLVTSAGGSAPNPVGNLPDARGIDDLGPLPPAAELLAGWAEISSATDEALEALTPAALDREATMRFPVDDATVLGAVAFLAEHDSYHVGQLALLRRAHGLAAMRYR